MGGIEPAVHVPVKPGKRIGWLLRKVSDECDDIIVVNVMNSDETLGKTKEVKERE